MTSSMLTGDRRWASSKRGGMTVLGKVTVPKPINLPSQRLENHGLDPNVEIVPKGTLSWGSRSSSATNAWGSSSLSPHADGGTSSPSRVSGRPSSGGSGTRPSTAGSDRAHEISTNAWASNSRPSSASGPPTANHTSLTSLRPHSAETRPGSSQLSRFAEPMTENLVGWASVATAEKLGISQPKPEEFSLSTGDFPTLGSDKDKSKRSTETQDLASHGRPDSSSGYPKENAGNIPTNLDLKGEPGHFWRRDNPPYSEDGLRPGVDKWQGNPLPYPNAHIPPPYEAWRPPPVNNPQGGIWFRGPPGGSPFGGPVPPSGFPVEPFTYYQPHLPPAVLSNAPPVPPPVAGPRGHHPKNGDVYRPQIPDAYIRPSMHMRPGFYPGPVASEGYYGPPMGYCSSNERDVPFIGTVTGPSVYNRYSSQHPPEPVNTHGIPGGYNSSGNGLISDHMEGNHPQGSGGPSKVLMKQQNDWDGKNDHQQWVDTLASNVPCISKGDEQGMPAWDAEQRSEKRIDENRESSSLKVKPAKSIGSHKASADNTVLKLAESASAADATLALPSAPRDPSLMQKIEGLNAKARDSSSTKIRVEGNKFSSANAKLSLFENESGNDNDSANQASHKVGAFNGDKNLESAPANGISTFRRFTNGMQGTKDHRIKGRLNSQDADGWQRKTLGNDSPVSSAEKSDYIRAEDSHVPVNVNDKAGPYNHDRHDGGSGQTMGETSDVDMQRAKMKELVKQRTKQLQEEEEERTRRQRAKALAKLEELNRRTQAADGSSSKLEESMDSIMKNKQGESSSSDLTPISSKPMAENPAILCVPDVSQSAEINSSKVEISSVLISDTTIDTRKSVAQEFIAMHKDSTPLDHLAGNSNVSYHDNSPKALSNIINKHRLVGHRHKQNIPFERSCTERFVSNHETIPEVETETGTGAVIAVTEDNPLSCASTLAVNTDPSVDPALHQKKKYNRNGKNKPKVEETLASFTPSFTSKEGLISCTANISKLKTTDNEPDSSSVMLSNSSNDASEQRVSSSNEEYHLRASNQWKSQQSRRLPKNSQSNRPGEKSNGSDSVIWAPVKSQSKTEFASESSNKDDVSVQEVFPAKNDEQRRSNSRNRRAEKEIYIPKPVAKEKAQQGSVQALTANQTTADENVGKSISSSGGTESIQPIYSNFGKVGSGAEPKDVNGKQNKHGKTQVSWGQQDTTEPTTMYYLHDGTNFSTNSVIGIQRSTEHHQTLKSDENTVIQQSKNSNQHNMSESTDSRENFKGITDNAIPTVKDQAVTIRERQHSLRGQKGFGVKHDNEHKANSWKVETSCVSHPSVEPNQAAMSVTSNENPAFTDRSTSQWRPKSPALPSNNLRGTDLGGGQNVGSQIGRSCKKDAAPHVDPLHPPVQDKQAFDAFQPLHVDYVSKRCKGGATQNHESPRDGKAASLNVRPITPDQGSVSLVEQVPTRMDFRHEQRSASGFRKNGNQSSRFSKGHEPRLSQNLPAHESKPYKQPGNQERQGQNMHYEYQPVRQHSMNNSERPRVVNQLGPRTRERGNQSRRGAGNFSGRQSSAIRVEAGYE